MDYIVPIIIFLLRKNVEVIFNFLINSLLYIVIVKQSEETEDGKKEESCF